MKQIILFDTDIGTDVDDMLALLLLVKMAKGCDIAVVTTNGPVNIRARVALTLLDKLKKDIPVFQGIAQSLTQTKPFIHGKERCGISTSRTPLNSHALVTWLLKKRSSSVTCITTAPLTTTAWLLSNKEIRSKISQVFLMGGSFPEKKAPSIEHNFSADSKAASILLKSTIPIFLIPLNLSIQCSLSEKQVHTILRESSDVGKFISQAMSNWLHVTKKFTGKDKIFQNRVFLHDPLTVLAALQKDEFQWSTKTISIDASGRILEKPNGKRILVATNVKPDCVSAMKRRIISI